MKRRETIERRKERKLVKQQDRKEIELQRQRRRVGDNGKPYERKSNTKLDCPNMDNFVN